MKNRSTLYRGLAACLFGLFAIGAQAAPLERQLELRLSMDGSQHWRNDPQATEASTHQDYQIDTRLRSDGILYSDNLLASNWQERLEIKQQYYARQGLKRLKARNGGKLPSGSGDFTKLPPNPAAPACRDEYECHNEAIEWVAAQTALDNNSIADLETFLTSRGNGDEPRYLYFFGYPGCPNRIHISYEVHVAGKRAYDHDRKKTVPYSLDRQADTSGNDEDRASLCEKFVATVDTKTGTVYFENIFIPSPTGTSVLNINGAVEKREIPLPPVAEMMNWITERMRKTADAGVENQVLTMHTPLDGDATVLGMFDGDLKLKASWSFKTMPLPPAAAPVPAKR